MRVGPGTPSLVALGCGTAIASVCAIGLFQIERLLGGVWSVAAVALAGLACLALARAFARLNAVLPSGAGLLAQLSRAHGKRAGLLFTLPYLGLTLFLVGAEANIVGALVARSLGAPPWAGAVTFLVGTWAVCRAGVKVGMRAQAWATWAMVAALAVLSLHALHGAHARGVLAARLLPPFPGLGHFAAGVGQAVFLFMGFELITSQAEVARSPQAVGRALPWCVVVLFGFYGLLSLGFSCLEQAPSGPGAAFVPQLSVAQQSGAPGAVALVALLTLLSSFTSFNGGLLGLARFAYALAAQGLLPRSLAKMDPKTLLPPRILNALLVLALGATVAVALGGMLAPSILAGAAAAAGVYAAAAWAREQAPFAEAGRPRWPGLVLALLFAALGVGAVADAGPALGPTLGLLAAAYGLALLAALRTGPRPALARPEVAHAD